MKEFNNNLKRLKEHSQKQSKSSHINIAEEHSFILELIIKYEVLEKQNEEFVQILKNIYKTKQPMSDLKLAIRIYLEELKQKPIEEIIK